MDDDREAGVGTRMALIIIALTLLTMLVLYEVINWRPASMQGAVFPNPANFRPHG